MEYFYFHIFSTFSFFLNRKFVEGVRLQLEHGPGKRWLQLEHLPNKSCANILIVHQHGFCKHESNRLKYNVTGEKLKAVSIRSLWCTVTRRESMFLAFCMGLAASGRKLCDRKSITGGMVGWLKKSSNKTSLTWSHLHEKSRWPSFKIAPNLDHVSFHWDGSLFSRKNRDGKNWAISVKRHVIKILSNFETEPCQFLMHIICSIWLHVRHVSFDDFLSHFTIPPVCHRMANLLLYPKFWTLPLSALHLYFCKLESIILLKMPVIIIWHA